MNAALASTKQQCLCGTKRLKNSKGEALGTFFGQSSFAMYAVAHERNVVKVDDSIDIDLLGPLGCGIQTGSGTVLNKLKPTFGESIAVYGCGAVGLSAIMEAKIVGAYPIVVVGTTPETTFNISEDILLGKALVGVVEGESIPQVFIPQLVRYHKDGKFPFDKLVKFYEFDEIEQAFEDSKNGLTVKPVLRMPR